MISVTFASNYINHHQLPFCKAMVASGEVDFTFLQMEEMDEERRSMGWNVLPEDWPFVQCYKDDPRGAEDKLLNSDMVIYGGLDEESYIQPRLNAGKPTIRYSERIYKEGQWKFVSPRGLKKKYHDHVRYRKAPVYLLCAGAYVASDFSLIHAYPGKMYNWGYFPEFRPVNMSELLEKKSTSGTVRILWAGRMIDWKHPEAVIAVGEALRKAGQDFHITMVGGGALEGQIKQLAVDKQLGAFMDFPGFMPPEEVRQQMLASDIYLFTSDFKEGWGAVLNEAMNSGCAVIASSGIGAVPTLLMHGKNGMVYRCGDTNELVRYALELCGDPGKRLRLGQAAYETIEGRWNPEYAAGALILFIKSVLAGMPEARPAGPVSKAPIISPGKGYAYTHRL